MKDLFVNYRRYPRKNHRGLCMSKKVRVIMNNNRRLFAEKKYPYPRLKQLTIK